MKRQIPQFKGMDKGSEQTLLQARRTNSTGKDTPVTGEGSQNHKEAPLHPRGWRESRGGGGIGTLTPCWWECQMEQPLWTAAWQFPRRLINHGVTMRPHTPLLGVRLREMNTHVHTYRHSFGDKVESAGKAHSTDGPWRHYAEWKKPDRKDHILYDSIDMKCPE